MEMSRADTLVLAIDPGLVCGWSLGRGHDLEQHGQSEYLKFMNSFAVILSTNGVNRVVAERMDPRRWDNDTRLTVEAVGALRWWSARCGFVLHEVNAADKKRTIDSVPTGFRNHERDAEAVRLWDLWYGTW